MQLHDMFLVIREFTEFLDTLFAREGQETYIEILSVSISGASSVLARSTAGEICISTLVFHDLFRSFIHT